ncbi:tetratricopeptide repeat protein [Candidatus Microgenomates bacterium]|nr:MAG: tetratricopeptide repeat protein [Candidatus Microgenomates bacterium]
MTEISDQSSTKSSSFPSISELFKQSWEAFTNSVLNLFILNIVTIVGYIVLGILFFVFLLALGAGGSLFQKGFNPANLLALVQQPPIMIAIIVGSLIFIALFIALSLVVQAGSILILDKYKEKISFGEIFRKSINFIIPLFLVNLLMLIIYLGATFVFIIPAILFYFLFAFVNFVIVLEDQKGIKAIKRSVFIVSKNFGPILARLLLLVAIYIAISVFIPNLAAKADSATGAIFGFFSFFINILLGWFTLAYTITLYKQAKERAGDGYSGLAWIWVVAILGWIIALIISFTAFQLISSGALNNVLEKMRGQSSLKQSKEISSTDGLIKSGQLKFSTAIQLINKKGSTEADRDQITGLLSGALADFKQATKDDPKDYISWYYLGKTYNNLIGVATNAEDYAVSSLNKAIELKPDCFDCYMELGGVYIFIKDYDNAIKNYQEASKLMPNSANAYFNLGIAYKRANAKIEAKKAFEKALQLLPINDPSRYKVEVEMQGL